MVSVVATDTGMTDLFFLLFLLLPPGSVVVEVVVVAVVVVVSTVSTGRSDSSAFNLRYVYYPHFRFS